MTSCPLCNKDCFNKLSSLTDHINSGKLYCHNEVVVYIFHGFTGDLQKYNNSVLYYFNDETYTEKQIIKIIKLKGFL